MQWQGWNQSWQLARQELYPLSLCLPHGSFSFLGSGNQRDIVWEEHAVVETINQLLTETVFVTRKEKLALHIPKFWTKKGAYWGIHPGLCLSK